MSAAPYEPTPEQIESECLAIQAEWTAEERERRWQYPTLAWFPPGAMKHRSPEDLLYAARGWKPSTDGFGRSYERDEEPLVHGD